MSRMTAPAEADVPTASRPALDAAARQLGFLPNVAPTQHLWSTSCGATVGRCCAWLPDTRAHRIGHTQCATHASCESSSAGDVEVPHDA
jgi:hypothetical protein